MQFKTTNEVIEKWLEYKLINEGRSWVTVDKYRCNLKKFSEYLEAKEKTLKDVKKEDLIEFTGMWLFNQGISPRTRRTVVSAIKGLFSWLVQTGFRIDNPGSDVPQPQYGKRLPKAMRLPDVQKLLRQPDMSTFIGVRDAAVLAILIGCGLRKTGVSNLNESSLIFENDERGIERLYLRVIEKRDKERLVPAPDETMLFVRAYLGHEELLKYDRLLLNGDKVLFVCTTNCAVKRCDFRGEAARLKQTGIYRLVRRHGKACGVGLDVLHPHALRHLYGTELAESGVDLKDIQVLLGHENIANTSIYLHMAVRKLTKEMDRGNPLGKINTPVTNLLDELRK